MKLHVNIRSLSDLAKGHGVDSAFKDLVQLLKKSEMLDISVNSKKKSDILHVHTIDFASFRLMKKQKKNGKKIVVTCHMMMDSFMGSLRIPKLFLPFLAKYLYSFYKQADRLVVVNPFYQEELIRNGIEKSKVTFIPNYASEELFNCVEEEKKKAIRTELGLPENAFVIMSAGQIQRRKGFDDFVETATLNPDFTFLWVGGFSFGKLTEGYEKYKKMIHAAPSNLKFPGIVSREKVAQFLQASDVFFLPSYQELFPMSVLEATKCGLPLLLRDIPLYHSILLNRYFSGIDAKSFSAYLHQMADDKAIYAKGLQDSKAVAQLYSESSILKQWEGLYQQLTV